MSIQQSADICIRRTKTKRLIAVGIGLVVIAMLVVVGKSEVNRLQEAASRTHSM